MSIQWLPYSSELVYKSAKHKRESSLRSDMKRSPTFFLSDKNKIQSNVCIIYVGEE